MTFAKFALRAVPSALDNAVVKQSPTVVSAVLWVTPAIEPITSVIVGLPRLPVPVPNEADKLA